MEVEENRRNSSSKRPRHPNLIGERDEDDDDATEARAVVVKNDNNSRILRQWHQQSSRIFRVSRASGGKDRHSKVYTAKGLRDRRVRLSVSTAIQFYDLQDRLGYDQPSKAIEWLIKAADSAISELPSLDTNFPPNLPDDIARPKLEILPHNADANPDPSYNQHSSTSETSKGSVLSLTSRSEIRDKARERARERAAKDKDRQKGHAFSSVNAHNLNPQSSFTELLTGATTSAKEGGNSGGANFFQKHMQPVTSTADYFTQFGQQQQKSSTHDHHQNIPSGFFGNNNNSSSSNSPIGMVQFCNADGGDHHHHQQQQQQQHPAEMQQFAFLQQDHFFPVAAATSGGDNYNLNFSISSGLASFHRGTLQSNSPSHHHQFPHHHHQQNVQVDGAGVPFLFGNAAATSASAHEGQYPAGFDSHLQLCDGYKHLEMKGKGKG